MTKLAVLTFTAVLAKQNMLKPFRVIDMGLQSDLISYDHELFDSKSVLYSISIFYLLLCYLFCHHDVIILNVNFDFFFFEFEFVRNGHYQTLYGNRCVKSLIFFFVYKI